jgi:hypothetical protein
VYELDSEGNMSKALEEVPTTIKRPLGQKPYESACYLKEVHEAMSKGNESPFEKLLNENRQQWETPELMQKITENPLLVAGMSNPIYTAALQEFQENPKNAMQKYSKNEHSKDILLFLTEFCGVLGQHFTSLGEEQKRQQQQQQKSLGPLAEKALRRHVANNRSLISEVSDVTSDEKVAKPQQDEEVSRILSNPELTQLLMDPEMQRVIQECTTSNGREKFRYYMQHPNFALKLQKLIKAGLLKIERP